MTVDCAFYTATGFLECLREQLQSKKLSDPACIAWFLLKLSTGDKGVREDKTVLAIIKLLYDSKAPGVQLIVQQLATIFTNTAASGISIDGSVSQVPEIVSLREAKTAMRPPGCRDHNNDPENFRDINILPTASELDCCEQPYLPPPNGSEFIANKEAATLDRIFRLMREDMLGSMRQELGEELKRKQGECTRLFNSPTLVGIDFKPEPHLILSIDMNPRLAGRVRKMKRGEAVDFFENGPGRKVLGQDSLVILLDVERRGDEAPPKTTTLAVGVVVERRSMIPPPQRGDDGKDRAWPAASLRVGVAFLGGSIASILPSLQGLQHRSHGRRLASHMFCASASLFAYEPVLRALQETDSIPLARVLVHLDRERRPPPRLAHAGRRLEEFSMELRAAVGADVTQQRALQLAMDSEVVLVQGPPGTGKTYVGVQMVKAMLEADRTWPCGTRLQILCLCYTNHALDSFLEALLDAGVPPELFVRLGGSAKMSDRLKPRSLRELPESKFNSLENRAFAGLKRRQEELEGRVRHLRQKLETSTWGKTPGWWRTVSEFLEMEHPEALHQFAVPADDAGFGIAGKKGAAKPVGPSYLWEQWCSGQDRGVFKTAAAAAAKAAAKACRGAAGGVGGLGAEGDVWRLKKPERDALRAQWNHEWLLPLHEELATCLEDLRAAGRQMSDLRLGCQSRTLAQARIIGSTTVAAAKLRGVLRQVDTICPGVCVCVV